MSNDLCITTLVEDTALSDGLLAEHGLSFWIEYGDKRILLDTGQSDILVKNAKALGIDLAEANAIVISHGHYDIQAVCLLFLILLQRRLFIYTPQQSNPSSV